MNTFGRPLTQRIPVIDGLWYRVRCVAGLHAWGRWERLTAELTDREGRKKLVRQIFVNVSECTTCGLSRLRHL